VVIFLVAAIVTPPDVVSQCMVAIPMLGLYQLSIFICRAISRKKKKQAESEDE
jgi:sec-independent protein translocase protein TatC